MGSLGIKRLKDWAEAEKWSVMMGLKGDRADMQVA